MHSADDFARQFNDNFVNKSQIDVESIKYFAKNMLGDADRDRYEKWDVEKVELAVKSLKMSKCLDCENLCISHVLFAHPAIYSCLVMLFDAIVRHGYVPSRMGMSMVMPTLKSTLKSVNDISNYRPISIMAVLGKILEKCVGDRIGEKLVNHSNQFGFVRNGGCGKALFTFRNVVDYFNEGGSKVICCSLDITKAFDRINHYALLKSMHESGIPAYIVRLFADWWCKLKDVVRWKGMLSQSFCVGSGVPQGSLLGGKFFNLLMDNVLNVLENAGMGCHIDGLFAGALAYADDLILLAPSLLCMQNMLDLCAEKCGEMGLRFNIAKCVTGVIGKCKGSCLKNLVLYNEVLPWNEELCYLGMTFKFGVHLSINASARSRKFVGSVASVLRGRVNDANDVYLHVIKTKCLPLLVYGIDCLRVDNRQVRKLAVVWNTAFRWVLGINRFESMRNILRQNGTMSFQFLIDLKFLLFIKKLQSNSNILVSKLVYWCYAKGEVKGLLRKYGLWSVSNVNEIKRAVHLKFDLHCDL
jgi:hypothetical protein